MRLVRTLIDLAGVVAGAALVGLLVLTPFYGTRVWTQGTQYLSGLIVKPTTDGNQTIVTTSLGAQFFNVQTSTHLGGFVSGAWGTGAKTGSGLVVGRNTSGDGAAGYLRFEQKDGTTKFLWVDGSGALRIGSAAPEEDGTPSDTSGSAIGTGGGGSSLPNTILVTDYGATCDGSTDDASAIQDALDAAAAIDAARVYFPAATCKIASGLVVGNGDGSGDGTTFISLIGVSAAKSVLLYTGSSSGTALSLSLNKNFTVEGLQVKRSGTKGTTVGIRQTGPVIDGGTQTLAAKFSNVIIDGFDTGMFAGGPAGEGKSSSEIVYETLSLQNNNVGWISQELNTLDHQFFNLLLSGNGEGLRMDAGNAYVNGGSASNSTTADFNVQCCSYGAVGTFEVRNFRSENAERFVKGYTAGGHLLIENNMVVDPANADDVAIDVGPAGPVQIRGNMLDAKILFYDTGSYGSAIIDGNRLLGDSTRRLPFLVKASHSSTDYINRFRVMARGNQDVSVGSGYDAYFDDVEGVWDGDNFRAARRMVWGNLDQALPKTSGNTTSLGQNPWTTGNNLRLAGTFASSGTLAVTFSRSETVTSNGGGADPGTKNWTVSSGHFTTADIGRRITISNSGTFYGYITKITDSTHIDVMFLPSGDTTGAGLTATVGENEPDANYRVMATCSAAEPIGISSITSSGFTATSTNSSSTAECTFLIVR